MKKKTPSKKVSVRKHPSRAHTVSSTKIRLGPVRRQLLAMRDDLMKTVRNQQLSENTMQDTGDSVDEASRSIEKELLFELSDNERVTLDQIEAALRKIDKGTYGHCEACRKPIAKARLQALLFARYCIVCQSSSESAPELVEQAPEFRSFAGGEDAPATFER